MFSVFQIWNALQAYFYNRKLSWDSLIGHMNLKQPRIFLNTTMCYDEFQKPLLAPSDIDTTLSHCQSLRFVSQNTSFSSPTRQIHGVVGANICAYNYYPFGSLQPGRNWNADKYSFGFNGKLNDNEVKGIGNSVDFGARIYDSRLGRFLSKDVYSIVFQNESPYIFAGNNPIILIDYDGKYKYPTLLAKQYKNAYPKLTNYLTNGIDEILESPLIMESLMEYGNFTEEDVKKLITQMDKGIEIEIVESERIFGANGYYMGGKDRLIQINKNLVDQLENGTPEMQQAALLAIVSTLLHESVHYGTWNLETIVQRSENEPIYKDDKIVGYSRELGEVFETVVYHDGNQEEFYKCEKMGQKGLKDMQIIINRKNKTEEGKKDIPRKNVPKF